MTWKTFLRAGALAAACASSTGAFAASISIGDTGPQAGSFDPERDEFSINARAFGVAIPLKFQNGIFGNPGLSSDRISDASDPNNEGAIASDVNVIVIQNFDNNTGDSTPPPNWDTSWNARTSLQAIANNTTGDRSGFFLYWNEGLGVNRLFAAENLNDGGSGLQLLFTIQSETLTGQPGAFDLNLSDGSARTDLFSEALGNLFSLTEYGADNFVFSDPVAPVPLPAGLSLLGAALGLSYLVSKRRKSV